MTAASPGIDAALATRLRTEREDRGWSLADMAARSGVSKAMISKVERGESSPTAALLGKLSAALGVTLSQLFSDIGAAPDRLSRRSNQRAWTDPETGFVRRTLSPQPDSPVELVWAELPAGAQIAYPAAAFRLVDQQITVLSGRLSFTEGGTVHELTPGDCLRLGPAVDCIFANRTRRPCTYIVAILRRKV